MLLVRVYLRELFVLGPSAVKILLRLEQARNVKSDAGGKFVAAGVSVSLEVAPGRFCVLGSQVQLA